MVSYRRLGFWFIVVIALLISFFVLKKTFSAVEVKITPVKRQELAITVAATSTGTIKPNNEVKITAQRVGRISRLLVNEGDTVKAGAVIAELDPEEAYLNLQIAQASLQRAQARLDELRAAFNPLKVEVETNIDKTKANLYEAENRLKRFKWLKDKGYLSQMEVDSVQREYDVARASLESAMAGREQLKAKGEEIKAVEATVREAQLSLSIAKLNYDYSFIKSPISGVIISRPVKMGETVSRGSLVAAAVSTESLYIESFIDEADVAKVKEGQEVHISMDAYPGKIFKGEVYMISPVVLGGKQETRTFEARTRFKEDGVVIKPGMSADTEIVVDSVKDTLIIPSQAVIEKGGKKFVYIKKGLKARLASVKTGLFNWAFTEIISGIKEGDEVVINPDVPGLNDGSRITVTNRDE